MNHNIPPRGRFRFHSRYRWVVGQSTLSPLQIENITSSPSNQPTSDDIILEDLNSDKSEEWQDEGNVNIESERISNLSPAANPINTSDALSNLPSTSSVIKESISPNESPQSER